MPILNFTTSESLVRTRVLTYSLPNLNSVNSAKVNTGSVTITNISEDKVTIQVSGGSSTRSVQTGGTYVPSDTKYVTGQTSQNYNTGGYSGVLNSYIYSNDDIPADTKFVTNQASFNYNSGGYSGTLSQYLHSGSYTPASTQTETDSRTSSSDSFPATVVKNGVTLSKNGSVSSVLTGGSVTQADTKYIEGHTSSVYNVGGYVSNSLTQYLYSGQEGYTQTLTGNDFSSAAANYMWNGSSWIFTHWSNPPIFYDTVAVDGYELPFSHVIHKYPDAPSNPDGYVANVKVTGIFTAVYSKTITTQGNAVYRYRGSVTRPYSDTRTYVYTQNYSGTKTILESDTRVYRYEGNVIRPASSNIIYRYQGNVTRPATDTRTYDVYYQYVITFDYIDFVAPPVNVNGVYREVKEVFANVNGVERKVTNIYSNVNGVWKQHVK